MDRQYLKSVALLIVPLLLMLVAVACGRSADTKLTALVDRVVYQLGFTEPEILPGELPRDLLVDIPVPDGAEVLGSLATSDEHRYVQVFLDVFAQPEEVLEFYHQSLTEAGWVEVDPLPSSGFILLYDAGPCRMFSRYEGEGPSLTICALLPEEGEPAEVYLYLDENPEIYIPDPSQEVLPGLVPPEGVTQQGGNLNCRQSRWGSVSLDSCYSDALLETRLAPSELHTHYQDQLLEAGWQLGEQGGNGTLAWSTWTVTDDQENEWVGSLTIHMYGEGNWRILHLQADLVS